MPAKTMGQAELYARVEVLKKAADNLSGRNVSNPLAADVVVAAAEEMWKFVVPNGRELDCGCGNKPKASPLPPGQRVVAVPIKWRFVSDSRGEREVLSVLGVDLYSVARVDFKYYVERDGHKDAAYSSAEEAIKAAEIGASNWLNNNVDLVERWIAEKANVDH